VRVVVVGAGVVGLTCAVRLAEDGHDTHVLARDLPMETTSAVAAAMWYPYLAQPRDAVTRWAARSFEVLAGLAGTHPQSGVRMRAGTELLATDRPADPWWRDAVPTLETVSRPRDGYGSGWRMTVPVADMATYLPFLVDRLAAAGGTITRSWLPELPDTGVVVNATGLASRALAGDDSLVPVRGQVVRVEQMGLKEWLLEDSDPARPLYVVPRERDVVVGGTADRGSWDRTPDPATARQVLARATALVPELAGAEVIGHRVGLRPARPTVRLEAVPHHDGTPGGVVHCYGHGGAGVTLSWGCADDVLAAVEQMDAYRGSPAPSPGLSGAGPSPAR
jgi:D-amino-acid oxidase